MENIENGFAKGEYTIIHMNKDREILGKLSFEKNVIVDEGIKLMLSYFTGVIPTNWYIGLYSGNYTPTASDILSTFPTNAVEFVGYNELTRQQYIPATPVSNLITNTASKAEFNINASSTIYGVFLANNSAKNGTSGALISGKRLTSPRTVASGDILLIEYQLTMTSAV